MGNRNKNETRLVESFLLGSLLTKGPNSSVPLHKAYPGSEVDKISIERLIRGTDVKSDTPRTYKGPILN